MKRWRVTTINGSRARSRDRRPAAVYRDSEDVVEKGRRFRFEDCRTIDWVQRVDAGRNVRESCFGVSLGIVDDRGWLFATVKTGE